MLKDIAELPENMKNHLTKIIKMENNKRNFF